MISRRQNRRWFTHAILKMQPKRDKNCIELREKIACGNGAQTSQVRIFGGSFNILERVMFIRLIQIRSAHGPIFNQNETKQNKKTGVTSHSKYRKGPVALL